jgi:hypothetical protein
MKIRTIDWFIGEVSKHDDKEKIRSVKNYKIAFPTDQ